MQAANLKDGRGERGDRTRDALLAAAREAFATKGFNGTSVRDIARAAGAHPASLTYHFNSKRSLYQRVIADAMGELREELIAAVASADSPRSAATLALSAYLDHLERDPLFPQLIQRGLMDGDPDVLAIASEFLSPILSAGGQIELAQGPLGEPRDIFLSFYGAAVVPYLYAPLLDRLFGEKTLGEAAQGRRRAHLQALTQLSLDALFPEAQ